MPVAITFDTLQFVKTLLAAQIPQRQAEAYAKAFKEANDNSTDSLATKQDIYVVKNELNQTIHNVKTDLNDFKNEVKNEFKDVRNEINDFRNEVKNEFKDVRNEIKEVRQEIDLKCAQLKVDLIKWMVTLAMGQAAVIVSLIKLIH